MSFSRYLLLLRHPELGAAITFSFFGRLPIGMTGLAILLFVQTRTGSYAEAGVAAGAYLAGLAIASPVLGRLIDRLGPTRVLLACAVLYPVSLVALIGTLLTPAGSLWAILFSTCAGAALPPVTVCMRTLYRQRLTDERLLIAALSLDSVLVEVVFIAGPMAVALMVAAVAPWAAVALGAVTGTAGTVLFMRSPAMRSWRPDLRSSEGVSGTLMTPGFVRILGVGFGFAIVFGLLEIAVTAYATGRAAPALAGWILGVMSIGSAAGGLVFGARHWHAPLVDQYATALVITGLGILPLAVLAHPVAFSVAAACAGIAMAPPLIIQSMLIAKTVPREQTAEAFTWGTTALLCGVGAGLLAGGWAVEILGVSTVFALAGAVALGFGVLTRRLFGSYMPA